MKKFKEGHKLDVYNVDVELNGVHVPAGTLYILRSLVEKHQISINLGPGEMPLEGQWAQDEPDDTDTPE